MEGYSFYFILFKQCFFKNSGKTEERNGTSESRNVTQSKNIYVMSQFVSRLWRAAHVQISIMKFLIHN